MKEQSIGTKAGSKLGKIYTDIASDSFKKLCLSAIVAR
jgi:hypothetical protein